MGGAQSAGLYPEDRDDVFQEVFLKVHRGLPSLRHGEARQTFRGWIRIITRNCIVDLARRRAAQPRPGMDHYGKLIDLAEDRLADSEANEHSVRQQAIARALAILKPEFADAHWRAFWRTAVDGLSATEAATELSLTPAAVRKIKSRVLARLRSEFEGLLD
jgi:RNA polymerase sigma-70 factor (ECF subfamily)